jgi:hypothetical protein
MLSETETDIDGNETGIDFGTYTAKSQWPNGSETASSSLATKLGRTSFTVLVFC